MATDVDTLPNDDNCNNNVRPGKRPATDGGAERCSQERPASAGGGDSQLVEYSKDQLMELKAAPLSRKKPKVFVEDSKLANLNCLKGSKQSRQKRAGGGGGGSQGQSGRERSDTPPDEPAAAQPRPPPDRPSTAGDRPGAAPPAGQPNKKSADPRERLKSEEEGCIVLSPQRRSFTTGCQAPPTKPKDEEAEREVHRELPTRRIGSGRIVTRADEARPRPAAGRFDRYDGRMDKPDHRDRERDRFDDKRGGDRDRDMRDRDLRDRDFRDRDLRDMRDRDMRERGERRDRGFGRDWMSAGGMSVYGGRDSQDVRAAGFISERERDGRGPPPNGRDRRRANGREQRDRRRGDDDSNQPEWFSAGPTSQNDMIELRGFDDQEDEEEDQTVETPVEAKTAPAVEPSEPVAASTEPAPPADEPFLDDPAIQSTIQHHRAPLALGDPADFDLDDILRLDMDSLPVEAVGGGPGAGGAGGSRFSRWFQQRQSPPLAQSAPAAAPAEQRRSSIQDELVGDILNGIEDLTLKIPASEPEAYFAPISPAHGGGGGGAVDTQPPAAGGDILSMLQRGAAPQPGQQQAPSSDDAVRLANKLAAMGGKTHSVADLEADIRPPIEQQQPQSQQQDTAAFNRLVSQLRAAEQHQRGPQPPPLDHFAQAAPSALSPGAGAGGGGGAVPLVVRPSPLLAAMGGPAARPVSPAPATGPPAAPHASVTQDNLLRLLHMQEQQHQEHQRRLEQHQRELEQQQQREMEQHHHHHQHQQQMTVQNLHKLLSMQRAVSPGPPQPQPQPSPLEQLMSIPEARNILIGLHTGRISRQHLIQQLHSQVLQPRLREIVVAVLRLPQRSSPLPEPLQAALRGPTGTQPPAAAAAGSGVSGRGPSPSKFHHLNVAPAAGPHRVPSPQEIRIHTQNILQQALIKRKLEEQKENFRKRQENRSRSPALEAAEAERRCAQPAAGPAPASLAFTPTAVIRNMKVEQRGSPEHRPKGRPLVKTQQDGGGHPAMSAANIQSVAAKLLETRAHMQQQQQWQLRPQQQPPQPAAAAAQLAGNPLARWFSPEVLASAQQAQLPMAPAQHRVLSVEELERHQVMN